MLLDMDLLKIGSLSGSQTSHTVALYIFVSFSILQRCLCLHLRYVHSTFKVFISFSFFLVDTSLILQLLTVCPLYVVHESTLRPTLHKAYLSSA
ncbi:hypothetical protein EV361DRAFT_520179 [Lentinula raphanica]|nr:hypothetical protein C8R42DRAFT_664202 [Lentinula raphanica]KAJ3975321.1 hypothetical protein EV361DRAFT_520179 [Lentinula raphanica]